MADVKKPATPTVTLKHLAAQLAEGHQLSKKQSEAVLGDLVSAITRHLKKGDRIRIGGLGILQVRKRADGVGRLTKAGGGGKWKSSRGECSGRWTAERRG